MSPAVNARREKSARPLKPAPAVAICQRDRVSTLACPVPAANRLPESASQDWNMVHPAARSRMQDLCLKEAKNG